MHKHIQYKISIKYKEQEKRDANNEITPRCVMEEETDILGKKPLCGPPKRNDPLVNKVGVQ